ncbi:FMN-dependent alpha-hydroxy acid dehydrogenase [Viridothelium virens]|uniref:FMN-dependent alpha-hydroxy acid dehydrogenase n=1 Tax=Viridothelium virens TaxID=1048519 RepID=A0A6A6HI41_VIRVR|nr:FMN-dependent alpha-hydroxy acid dehydrogenase [Viridothelium virens]
MDGIVVSNHGGRQVDGAIGSLDMLPEVVDCVKGPKTMRGDGLLVLFDGGVRTEVDIIKVLCLGAQGVLMGRPWVYSFGTAGKEGMEELIKGILADLDQSMGLL